MFGAFARALPSRFFGEILAGFALALTLSLVALSAGAAEEAQAQTLITNVRVFNGVV